MNALWSTLAPCTALPLPAERQRLLRHCSYWSRPRMARSPLQGPEFPAVAEPPVLPQLDSPTSAQVAAARDDADAIFLALGDFIAGTQDVDVILGAIAEAAQRLTQSGGVAIAMRRNEVVVCLGRSGEMAPPLGTRLSVDSGISGECLRTGKHVAVRRRQQRLSCRSGGLPEARTAIHRRRSYESRSPNRRDPGSILQPALRIRRRTHGFPDASGEARGGGCV